VRLPWQHARHGERVRPKRWSDPTAGNDAAPGHSAAGIFLIFPIVSLVAFGIARPRGADAEDDDSFLGAPSLFANAARATAALPLLFSLYLAAVPAYSAHFGILFGFLFVLAAGLLAISIVQGPQSLHFLGAVDRGRIRDLAAGVV
jgi:hypothetical protein